MVTLVLIRHAKAEAHREDDHSRVLSDRGRAQCEQVRTWLTEGGVQPGRVVVSTAARARETWELSSVGSADPEYDDRVYEAAPEDLREVIAETGRDVGTLVLVGHNPSMERLAWELDDSAEARDRTNLGLSTSGVAVLSLESWSADHGRLVELRH